MSPLESWTLLGCAVVAIVVLAGVWAAGIEYEEGRPPLDDPSVAPRLDLPIGPRLRHTWHEPLSEHEGHAVHLRAHPPGGTFLWCGSCSRALVVEARYSEQPVVGEDLHWRA